MSRPRFSASTIIFRSTALALALAWPALATADESRLSGQVDSGWQATASRDVSGAHTTSSQWAPVRAHARRNSISTPAITPGDSGSYSETADDSVRSGQLAKSADKKKDDAVRDARGQTGAAVRSNQHTSHSRWQLPNESAAKPATNPARSSTNNASREPRPFTPPSNAAKMTAGANANSRASASQRASANRHALQNKPINHVQRLYTPPSAALTNNHSMASQASRYRIADRPAPSTKKSSSYGGRMWDTINVAFQAPEEWTEQPENLPLPDGGGSPSLGSMVPTPGYTDDFEFHDGPGGCDDGMCGCGQNCGCGDSCDPSCGCGCGDSCEPGCGCPNGGNDELCCIGCDDDQSCHTVRMRIPKWQELTLIGGVQGFKGPYDRDRDSGNFGFHEGINIGAKMPFSTLGYQIGYQAVHSQLNGDKDQNISDPHTQQFATAGIFKREKNGVQMGIVWDMLRDERWGAVDFHQLRGEMSFIENGCHEIGVAVAAHLNDHEIFPNPESASTIYQASDQYLLFYRFHGCRGGEGRFFGGFNDDNDGIIGADMLLPLQDRWSLQGGFTYLIPDAHAGAEGAAQEAWNIGLGLVWHWDCRARKSHSSCYRPLFNVADNGYLIVDDRPGRGPIVVDEE